MFISLKESIDTNTPIGKAMMFITATFAQMERETIAARVTDNLAGLARKGFWTGGKAPQGYVLEHIEVNGKKHVTLAIDPEAAARCTWIFNTFLDNNYTIGHMQTEFRKQGIRTERGCFFSASQIYQFLTMPYCVERRLQKCTIIFLQKDARWKLARHVKNGTAHMESWYMGEPTRKANGASGKRLINDRMPWAP